jgi:L-asparaginase/Glu-tRNA(Gln) amidotransferase subunit D
MTNLAIVILLLTPCFRALTQQLPTVAVLSTGGTIASKQDPAKGGSLPATLTSPTA